MSSDATLIKELREKTGAGIVECKKALIESNGDINAAIDLLRKKGVVSAAKKSSRIAADGLSAVFVKDKSGVAVEINAETDFVAKNDQFKTLVSSISETAINCSSVEELNSSKMHDAIVVSDAITNAIAIIGENITLRRMEKIQVQNGFVASYVHGAITKTMGKISVLVGVETDCKDEAAAKTLGSQIAMHIAAAKPICLHSSEVDSQLITKEKEVFFEQYKASGKPDNIVEKMVEGRVKKFYEESVLLEQIFVVDGKTKISDLLVAFEKQNGCKFSIAKFVRYEVGEGIEEVEAE
jgi:elongation factor Ts